MKNKTIVDKITILYIIVGVLMLITLIIGAVMILNLDKPEPTVSDETPVVSIPKSTTQIEFTKVVAIRNEPEPPQEIISEWVVDVSETELEEMSRVVMNEASILPYIGKVLVAQVMVNRLQDGRWGDTMHDVLYYDDAFSHADSNGDVTDECRAAVLQALECGNAFPKDLLYFRTDHPHSFAYKYCQIGNTFFCTEEDYGGGED